MSVSRKNELDDFDQNEDTIAGNLSFFVARQVDLEFIGVFSFSLAPGKVMLKSKYGGMGA